MPSGWIWLQLAVAWLPMWALFTAVIVMVHGQSLGSAAVASLRMIAPGALLGIAVYRFASRMPWPHPFQMSFVAMHVLAAGLYGASWFVLISAIDSLLRGQLVIGLFLLTGIWLYIVVAGVAYANLAAQRTAVIEAHTARMQLDTLRSQLHPHFLFNALHTVVQLIPTDPRAATRAAEQLADVLRTAIEEQRDLVSVAEEWAFVERYLAIERIRFGDRLTANVEIEELAREAMLPSFSLQTLVENAVRHGAAPRIEATHLHVSATLVDRALSIRVADNGVGGDIAQVERSTGTGLRRLRERMRWLYGDRARLDLSSARTGGFIATLVVPQAATNDVGAVAHDGSNGDE
jgi:hypothetical protein